MKYIWILQISYLFTECVVESVCSVIKYVYNDKRGILKGKKLKELLTLILMLPDDGTNRSKIVKWIANEYWDKYGDTVITNSWYQRFRKRVRKIVKSKVLDRKYGGTESVFIGNTFLLSIDD